MVQELEQAIVVAQDAVAKQGDTVRSLKASLKDGKIEKVRQAGSQQRTRQFLWCIAHTCNTMLRGIHAQG